MTDRVVAEKLDEAYYRVRCDAGVAMELYDYFSFHVPGFQYMPLYRARAWDGKVRLFDARRQTLFTGLSEYLKRFCDERQYELAFEPPIEVESFSREDAEECARAWGVKPAPRDYQLDTFAHCVAQGRGLMLVPTASGKSLIMYMLTKRYLEETSEKILIIVPNVTLVKQLVEAFRQYGYDGDAHEIYSGQEKRTDAPLTVTTWQSVFRLKRDWFNPFGVVIGDEAHGFKAKSLTSVMTKLANCKRRFGFTGTIDDAQAHQLVLEGLFGPLLRVTTTTELIDRKFLSPLKIMAIVLEHGDEDRRAVKKMDYQGEVDFILAHEQRNRFLVKLAKRLKGNTLVLFERVDAHGKPLYTEVNRLTGKDTYYVSGETPGQVRHEIRRIAEEKEDVVIVASMGTFREGIDMPSIENIVLAHPGKAKIRLLQAIGRGLRKKDRKMRCTVYDVSDDISPKRGRPNYSLAHFIERVKIYATEGFDYEVHRVRLEDSG